MVLYNKNRNKMLNVFFFRVEQSKHITVVFIEGLVVEEKRKTSSGIIVSHILDVYN